MNPLNLELIEHPKDEAFIDDPELPQTSKIALRLMKAGKDGLTTAQLFAGLFCAKYTSRISNLRRMGHIINAARIDPNNKSTAQWRYTYGGYEGNNLPGELGASLARWYQNNPRKEEG